MVVLSFRGGDRRGVSGGSLDMNILKKFYVFMFILLRWYIYKVKFKIE